MNDVITHLRTLMVEGDGARLTDGQLLECFVSRRDAAALEALVRRHGPMVWGVCRRVLPNYHDAENAFQATFLVLVRKAASITSRELVANWIYAVAVQTALKARTTAAKRCTRESQVTEMPEPAVAEQTSWPDLRPLLDQEMSRLLPKYRAVIVLCDLEGKSRKEAAQQLGVPEGTIASRMATARTLLAKRLARHGLAVSAGALAAGLTENVASAGVPTSVVSSAIKAANLLAAGKTAGAISVKVIALTDGVVKAMFLTKIKSVLAVMLVVAALAGATGLIYQAQAGGPTKDAQKKDEEKLVPAQPTPPPAKSDRERMVGNWFIMNEDSGRKGEMWVITEDSILMHAKHGGRNSQQYAHRLDASKNPKQIDITVSRGKGETVGVIKGIYVLDGDELRLCLGEIGKDRPGAFPEKPRLGEVLILQRAISGASPPPKVKKEDPPVATGKEEKPPHFVEKPDMKPQLDFRLPHKVEGEPTEMSILVPSKAFIADIVLPGKIRFRELIDPRYLKKHGLTDRDIAYEILDHQGLHNYHVADDLRTVLFVVHSKGGGKELIIVRWVVYEGHLYIAPEKAPDPKTGIFKPWILRTKLP